MGALTIEPLCEAVEAHAVAAKAINRPHHLDKRSTETVKLPHDEHVLGPQEGEGGVQLRPFAAGAARFLLLKNAVATGFGQGGRVAGRDSDRRLIRGHSRFASPCG